MRVIAGTARGRRLRAPVGPAVRPTGDRVREAVFNRLQSMDALDGARVADLFSGTGALGIEALSRGAASVVFVDDDPRSLRAVRANLESTGFGPLGPTTAPAVDVVRDDATRWAGRQPPTSIDVALADPPYAYDGWDALLSALRGCAQTVVVETDHQIDLPPGWGVARWQRYGGTVVGVLVARSDGTEADGR